MQNQVQSMINYFRNICLNQKQPNRTRNALSRFRGTGLKIPKSCQLVLPQNFLPKIFDLVTFDHVSLMTLRWHVLRVCTYKSNMGYGTRFQACSHKERNRAEIPKLLKYFNNFESNCYIKYLFNFRTGTTFNFFFLFFRGTVQ